MTENKALRKRGVMMRSFLGGIAWGVGSVIGATVIVAILLTLLHSIGWVPVLGDIANQISKTITPPALPKTGP